MLSYKPCTKFLTSSTVIFKITQAHGRPTLKNLVQAWNKTLQKEVEQAPSSKTDAASAFLASLEDPKLTSLSDASKKPPIEILPPGMSSIFASITAPKKPLLTQKTSQQEPTKPLAIEEAAKPLAIEAPPTSEPPQTESAPENTPAAESAAPETAAVSESATPKTEAVDESAAPETAAVSESTPTPVDGQVTETVSEPTLEEKEETSVEDKSAPSSTPNTEMAVATEDISQATTPTPPPQPQPETVTTTVKPTENASTGRQQVTYPPIRSQPIDFDFLNG